MRNRADLGEAVGQAPPVVAQPHTRGDEAVRGGQLDSSPPGDLGTKSDLHIEPPRRERDGPVFGESLTMKPLCADGR